jgi:hypothetical protein
MKSAEVKAFFSCSFEQADREVNDFFKAICEGLNIVPINVDKGYSAVPPEKAKQFITESPILIAIITKRTPIADNKWHMPSSVRDEIAMAYGMGKPVLMFTEEGVVLDGFTNNYCTNLQFNKDTVCEPTFVTKAINSLHIHKMEAVSSEELSRYQGAAGFFTEYSNNLRELIEVNGDFCWKYSSTRKLIFDDSFNGKIIFGAWADCMICLPVDAEPIVYDITIDSSSRDFSLKVDIEKQTPDCFQGCITLDPIPVEKDFIEYSSTYIAKYLNPIYKEDIIKLVPLIIDNKPYIANDGNLTISHTKKLVTEFRFPRRLNLKDHDIRPFVGCYSTRVNYIVESEIKRLVVEERQFAGNIEIRLEIDNPLIGYMYGIAWNPPSKNDVIKSAPDKSITT